MLDLPPAISVHQLLYGHAPKVSYPVSIHNFSDKAEFPVKVEVVEKDDPEKLFHYFKILSRNRHIYGHII